MNRRDVVKWSGLLLVGGLISQWIWLAASFLRSLQGGATTPAGRWIELGPVDTFTPGTVTPYPQWRLHLVRLAENQYRQALQLDERYVPAGMNLAVLLSQQGRNAEARRLLEQIVADNPGFGEAAFSLGLLLAEMRDYELALDQLRSATRLMPDHARAHYNLGQLADFQRRDDEAAAALERAVALAPHEPSYLAAMAEFYLRRRRLDGVLRSLAIAEKHGPNTALHRQIQHAADRLQHQNPVPEDDRGGRLGVLSMHKAHTSSSKLFSRAKSIAVRKMLFNMSSGR